MRGVISSVKTKDILLVKVLQCRFCCFCRFYGIEQRYDGEPTEQHPDVVNPVSTGHEAEHHKPRVPFLLLPPLGLRLRLLLHAAHGRQLPDVPTGRLTDVPRGHPALPTPTVPHRIPHPARNAHGLHGLAHFIRILAQNSTHAPHHHVLETHLRHLRRSRIRKTLRRLQVRHCKRETDIFICCHLSLNAFRTNLPIK